MKYSFLVAAGGFILIIGLSMYNFTDLFGSPKNVTVSEITKKQSQLSDPTERLPLMQNNIPRDIHIAQVKTTDAIEFALVQRPSMNIYLEKLPLDFPANFAGVLNWNGRDLQWEKVAQVEDVNPEISSKNNPVSLRFEGPVGTDQVPYLTVVDQNGAGSGEGIAKVLIPKTIDWKNWEVVECYYWSDGKKVDITPKLKLSSPQCRAVKVTAVFE